MKITILAFSLIASAVGSALSDALIRANMNAARDSNPCNNPGSKILDSDWLKFFQFLDIDTKVRNVRTMMGKLPTGLIILKALKQVYSLVQPGLVY